MSKYKIIIHGKNYCHIFTYQWYQKELFEETLKEYNQSKEYRRLVQWEKNTHEFLDLCVFDSNGMVI